MKTITVHRMRKAIKDQLFPYCSSRYGAPMGRMGFGTIDPSKPVYVGRVPVEDHDYDIGGAYWGTAADMRVRYQVSDGIVVACEYFRR